MFDLNIGDFCHRSFNGDSYPFIVVEHPTVYRNRLVCTLKHIPVMFDDIRIIPPFDMYKGEFASESLIPADQLMRLLNTERITTVKIIQSVKKDYWHDMGDPHPTFKWLEGFRYSQNPCF